MGSGIDGGAPKYCTSLCHESAPSSSLLPQFRIHAVVFASEQASIRQYVTRENNQINAAAHGISAGRREERRRRAPHCPLAPFPRRITAAAPANGRSSFNRERDRKQLEQHISTLHIARPPPPPALRRRSFLRRIELGCMEVRNTEREGEITQKGA